MEGHDNKNFLKQFIASSVLWALGYGGVYGVIFHPLQSDLFLPPYHLQIAIVGILAFISMNLSVYYGLKVLRWR